MSLSVLDRFVKRVKPVNTLVEKLCERLLPHEEAHASCGRYTCLDDWGCGVRYGVYLAAYCNGVFVACGCA